MAEVTKLRLQVMNVGVPAYVVARQTGISYSKLSNYMTGTKELPRRAAEALSHYLRCETCEVVGWVDLGKMLSLGAST